MFRQLHELVEAKAESDLTLMQRVFSLCDIFTYLSFCLEDGLRECFHGVEELKSNYIYT